MFGQTATTDGLYLLRFAPRPNACARYQQYVASFRVVWFSVSTCEFITNTYNIIRFTVTWRRPTVQPRHRGRVRKNEKSKWRAACLGGAGNPKPFSALLLVIITASSRKSGHGIYFEISGQQRNESRSSSSRYQYEGTVPFSLGGATEAYKESTLTQSFFFLV